MTWGCQDPGYTPDWLRQAEAADRYNLWQSAHQGDDGEERLPPSRKFTEEEHRASVERVRRYSEERAKEQVAAYYARKAANAADCR